MEGDIEIEDEDELALVVHEAAIYDEEVVLLTKERHLLFKEVSW